MSNHKSDVNRPLARVVLIGAGHMGQIRAKAIHANERFDLCGVCDADFDAAETLANRYRVRLCHCYSPVSRTVMSDMM